MRRPLNQIVDDYYRNSPEWPLPEPTDLAAEVEAFMLDTDEDAGYTDADARLAIAAFWAEEQATRAAAGS